MIEELEPHWDHNRGYSDLGAAAFKAADFVSAERFLTKLKEGSSDWVRSKEMSTLAQIWHDQGKADQARGLLVDCLRGLLDDAENAKSDFEFYEECYQHHRTTFLELFADGEATLSDAGLPKSTLK